MRIPRPARFPLLLLPLLAPAFLGWACGGGPEPVPRGKVLVIGLDGAEWSLLKPMVDAGEMPALASLMERGVYGNLRSLEPAQKSPAIWTTMATGKSPDEHGITTFVDRNKDGSLLTGNQRKVPALWNILSGVDRTVGVVGWLVTWPAEEVNGFVVSDYLQYGPAKSDKLTGRVYPSDLEAGLRPHVREWETFPWANIRRFLSVPLDTVKMTKREEASLRPIRWITAADQTFADIALDLYEQRSPDFMTVYLRGMDAMGHIFWNYSYPDRVEPSRLDDRIRPYVGEAMRQYYRYIDELIDPIIALADPETTILVVSDHGFQGGPEGGVAAHTPDGVLIMAGRGVGARGEITGATVYDIAPTVLVLEGLPPAEDMPGKVLWSALDESIPRERFHDRIPTYGTSESGSPIASDVDEEILERLRSLGYID